MSSTVNQKQSLWKTVEATLRSKLAGDSTDSITVLTADDAATWSKTLILNCLILQDLLPDGSRLRSDGSLKQWCYAIAKADILDVARGLKEFQLFLRCYPDEWAFLGYDDFKHRYPYKFTGDFWSPVKDVLLSYLQDPCAATFKVLNQWVSFPLKLTLEGMASDLTQKAEQEYLDNEARLSALDLPDDDCDAIATVIGNWFSSLSFYEEFRPHHSNGAVANRDTRLGLLGKYRKMQSDYRISSLYRKFGLNEVEFGFTRSVNRTIAGDTACAKLITVPKGIDKRRMICPEPAEYQFNQQGVWDILDKFIRTHSEMSRHISIHDQTVNQEAALAASKYCDAATIDLSSASDSVSWRLVKRVCRKAPELLWMLWATRSTSIRLSSGQIVNTNKFAPMGSALCFPFESVLFAAICQVAVDNTNLGRVRDTYHVYGDDIIVPSAIYSETCRLLSATGFIVNEQKTFSPYCRFKESCGIEGLDGNDVTPIGISRKFSAKTLDASRPKLVACYVALANELWRGGFVVARTFVLQSILSMPINYLPPFSWSSSMGIASPEPTNYRSKRRYSEDLQCEEIRVGCIASSHDPDPFSTTQAELERRFGRDYEEIRYLETLRRLSTTKRRGLNDPEDLIQVSLGKAKLHLVSRWLPAWWFEKSLTSPVASVFLNGEHLYLDIDNMF